ncbi:MAG: DMT family transporter [Jatrophihabitans sp.]|uniref:DMT family transporter n=1 Tax=Jatrophihabitans sp. TaxID=1932789 RepID=UPI003910C5AE
MATSAAPVADVLLVRYGLAAVVCGLIVLAGPDRRCTRDELAVGCLLGVTLAAVLIVETTGVARTSAANAGVIISLTIVLTPVLEAGHGRRLPPSFFVAAGVCVAGVTVLVCGSGLSRPGTGDALMVLAAVIRAVHLVLVARLTAGRSVRPLHLTAVQMLVGTALCACGAAGQLARLSAVGAGGWIALLYLAVLCSVFAFLAQTWAVQRTSASRAGLLLGTEPIWAVATGVVVGGERLSVVAMVGAVLVIGGVFKGQSVERAAREGREDRACPTRTPIAA